MANIVGYHRPASIAAALDLLAEPGTRRVLLGGGTIVNTGRDRDPVEVIDLQAAGIAGITDDDGRLRFGAMVTLARFADDARTPDVLASLARREAPSTLRAAGTLGGLVATADGESELLAGLLAFDAVVTVVDAAGAADRSLSVVLGGEVGGIITSVTVAADGVAAAARTARTPADRAIVSAVARAPADGDVRLALSGVAATPLLVDDVSALDPPGDFRGSSSYRKHLATTLAGRVLEEVAPS